MKECVGQKLKNLFWAENSKSFQVLAKTKVCLLHVKKSLMILLNNKKKKNFYFGTHISQRKATIS